MGAGAALTFPMSPQKARVLLMLAFIKVVDSATGRTLSARMVHIDEHVTFVNLVESTSVQCPNRKISG